LPQQAKITAIHSPWHFTSTPHPKRVFLFIARASRYRRVAQEGFRSSAAHMTAFVQYIHLNKEEIALSHKLIIKIKFWLYRYILTVKSSKLDHTWLYLMDILLEKFWLFWNNFFFLNNFLSYFWILYFVLGTSSIFSIQTEHFCLF